MRYFLAVLAVCGAGLAQPPVYSMPVGTGQWIDATEYETFHLVVPQPASPTIRQAALAFQNYWKQVTDKKLGVSGTNEGARNIWLGVPGVTEEALDPAELSGISAGGCLVRTYTPPDEYAKMGAGQQLFVVGTDDEGTLNGVYAFFHEVFRLRWLEPGVTSVVRARYTMPQLSLKCAPAFAFRDAALCGAWREGVDEYRRGAHLPGAWTPPPPGRGYFDGWKDAAAGNGGGVEAVEYGNDAGAARIAGEIAVLIGAGPDSPNPELRDRRTAVEWPRGSGQWSLNGVHWLSPRLSAEGEALNRTEESPAAAVIRTANLVAESLRAQFPDVAPKVHVLLPPFLRRPPKSLRPVEGVVVQLSNADADFSRPLGLRSPDPANQSFAEDLRGWRRLGAALWVLDHLCNSRDPLLPFPNLNVIQDNIYLYLQHEVRGLYFDGGMAANPDGVELAALRLYLAARLMWNPDQVVEELVDDFARRYYGPGADAVLEYLRLMTEARLAGGARLALDDDAAWLDDASRERVETLIVEALKVPMDPDVKPRLEALLGSLRHVADVARTSRP